MGAVMQHLREVLPRDTIFCNGAGNFATWVHPLLAVPPVRPQLAPTSGQRHGLRPAGRCRRAAPVANRTVVVFAGDGDFLMHGQEFATAVQYRLPVIVVLLDNGMYGTIRMHQEREYPHRVSGTALQNPDFAAYARAFGSHGARGTHRGVRPYAGAPAQTGPGHASARAAALPDRPRAITPSRSLSQIRVADQWNTLQQKLVENRIAVVVMNFLHQPGGIGKAPALMATEFCSDPKIITKCRVRNITTTDTWTTTRGIVQTWRKLDCISWAELVAYLKSLSFSTNLVGWFFFEVDGPYFKISSVEFEAVDRPNCSLLRGLGEIRLRVGFVKMKIAES